MKVKSIIYVDGFNLFYGLLKGSNYKWLDIQKYFEYLRTDDNIITIKYFTTEISGSKKINQKAYLDALKTLPKVQIYYGKFKTKDVECFINRCHYKGNRIFYIPIEKRTDVNIASNLVSDSMMLKNIKRLIIISGDPDLVPAIKKVKEISPKKEIIVYVPLKSQKGKKDANAIRRAADKHKTLPSNLLSKSQFYNEIINRKGQ